MDRGGRVSLGEQSKRRGQRRALNGLKEVGVYFGGWVLPPSDISLGRCGSQWIAVKDVCSID